ncbi:N-acetylmuramoyl-L-alanine amidase [Streptomyces sp. LP11]|uniref:N-acetylmuramoyl-L-alanine amidase n=1 Tax=Streptomyces pyxinicus TaxID=2970331 RepID=A0ABT2AXX2_9ACTN|nr:N-acetylmuramoyl-L-alanine amidase [Streptomyces sp. LP11]MCS0601090.1 N-acetylmuramoyl-L-alanine amidase [Streptomyces sp. LP11]
MTAHIYPGADRTTQWFHSAYEGDTMPHPNVIVLHTTEGSSWPSYSGGSVAPTFTVHPDGRVRQHFYANESARALVNAAGGVQTNTLNCVQIELIGTCDKGGPGVYWPSATDAQLAGLAKLVKWLTATYPIPLKSTSKPWLAYPSSYGSKNGQRMSFSEWENFNGIAGHQHVPENDHGDPGNFPIARLIKLAGGASAPAPATKPVVDLSNVVEAARKDPSAAQGHATHAADVKIVEAALKAEGLLSAAYASDGSFGTTTIAAYKKLQQKLGYSGADADGIPGLSSLKALGAKHGFTVKA